jgi:hypothetical protein
MGLLNSLSAKEGYCFASNQYLADALGMKTEAVRKCLLTLESKKLITRFIKRKENNEIESREIRLTTPMVIDSHTPMVTDSHTYGNRLPHNKEYNKKENNISIERFEEFWNIYNKKVGKDKAKAKWSKLKEKEIEDIFKALPLYVSSREVKYRKDPERYIGHRVWEDEEPNTTITTTPLSTNKITEIIIPDNF